MENQESFDEMIRVNLFLLKFSGIIRASVGKISLTEILSVLAFGLLAAMSCSYLRDLLLTDNMEVAMQSLAFMITGFGNTLHYILIAKSRAKLCDVLATFEDLWGLLEVQEKRVLMSYVRDAKKLTYFFMSQCAATVFLYVGAPVIFGNGFVRVNGNITERMLPYSLIFECKDSPCYEILYILQILTVINIAITYIGVDTIGPVLILTVSGHMKIIQNRIMSLGSSEEFENFKNDKVKRISDYEISHFQYFGKSFEACVKYHQTVLKLCKDIEKVTNKAFLVQLITSTYSISAIGFKMNDSDKSKYVTQIVLSLVQLFLCNWPPDVLQNEILIHFKSQAVAYAAYFMPWYRCSRDVKKSTEIIIMRGQRVVRLTAGNFVDLSLETFIRMVSSALSFFTLLRSIE
ncbi:odorant receptor 13a isoform X2 [Cephus cinctus]|uniref:Odorant receptor n=1 Tax=Cephus cinctus TaxID=211228 RepID=A0AAJ7CHV9_CEPCN|nr:odorant receptor 13a isoform X2 [Cephus cinctus]